MSRRTGDFFEILLRFLGPGLSVATKGRQKIIEMRATILVALQKISCVESKLYGASAIIDSDAERDAAQ
jgi:hypothetical protein